MFYKEITLPRIRKFSYSHQEFVLLRMGKQDRDQFARFIEKMNYGPGPAAYNSLTSLKSVITRHKPNFLYYSEKGYNSSVTRRTVAAKKEVIERYKKMNERDIR